jgi:hypothetical protein
MTIFKGRRRINESQAIVRAPVEMKTIFDPIHFPSAAPHNAARGIHWRAIMSV